MALFEKEFYPATVIYQDGLYLYISKSVINVFNSSLEWFQKDRNSFKKIFLEGYLNIPC